MFSTVEGELVAHAERLARRTVLQEQQARERAEAPTEDFGPTLVGRTFWFAGHVDDVERTGGFIHVHLAYRPHREATCIREPGEGLQRVLLSDSAWQRGRSWRITAVLPDDTEAVEAAADWGEGTWLMFEGRIEQTEGLQLKRTREEVMFASNRHVIQVAVVSLPKMGLIARGESVALVLDTSGSMSDVLGGVVPLVSRLVQSLHQDNKLAIVRADESPTVLADRLVPATRGNIDSAIAFVARWQARGRTNMERALALAAGLEATHIWVLTDGQFGEEADRVHSSIERLRKRARVQLFVLSDSESGMPRSRVTCGAVAVELMDRTLSFHALGKPDTDLARLSDMLQQMVPEY